MKIIFLYLCKWLGFFILTRYLLRKKALIVTYHGFEVLDEAQFRPKLFIKKSTFEQRLQYLQKYCNVIKLDDLLNKNKPNNAIVITIDDGWASTLTVASPLLNHFNFPYTIYLTTENVLAGQPVFDVLLAYILRNSLHKTLCINGLYHKPINTVIKGDNIAVLTEEVKQLQSTKNDIKLLRKVAASLNFPIESLIDEKVFTLLSVKEVKGLSQSGADIQLHTHSHHNYIDDELIFNKEITINQQHIENITGIKPVHHCYPSGQYSPEYFDYLKLLGIRTATTCKPGFCDDRSNKFELPRFLDGENIPQIVFEAEVSGVLELLRKLTSKER